MKSHSVKHRTIHTQKTRKTHRHKYSGKIEGVKNGWKLVHIWGDPYERGFAHGRLLHKELDEVFRVFPFAIRKELNTSYSNFVETSNQYIYPLVKTYYPEFYDEIRGIAAGYRALNPQTQKVNTKLLVAWNAYMSLYSIYKEGGSERCSAFIATGPSATKTGKIVMAHNSHTDYASGAFSNIVLRITPASSSRGASIRMQTAAGLISSITDWFICGNGLLGCETTIAGIRYSPEFGKNGHPLFCRIRRAMQYAETMDDMAAILLEKNAGDYACSWLLGDIRTNEIMRFEIGLKTHSIARTTDGVFYGMNSAVDQKLRELETGDMGGQDLENTSGSRSYRLHSLLTGKYGGGKIDAHAAKDIISDHYDSYLCKTNEGSRSICRHTELDPEPIGTRLPFYPFGAIDGKVVTAKQAGKMEFWGRWGSSCGKAFHPRAFVRAHPEYSEYLDYLPELPSQPWVQL
jgi:hypothetical protein